MRPSCLFLGTLMLLAGIAQHPIWASQAPAVTVNQGNPFEKPVQDIQRDIDRWDRSADIQITFIVVVIILAPFLTIFQGSTKKWAKVVTLALGVLISIFTGINARVFSADYRSYQRAATEGRAVVVTLDEMNATFAAAHPSGPDLQTFDKEFKQRIEDFHQITRGLEGTIPPNYVSKDSKQTTAIQILPVVHAQSGVSVPAWVENLPSDSHNFFFLGKSSQPSLSNAKIDSLNDALGKASSALNLGGEPYTATVASLVKDSAVVQDTFFIFDNKSSAYVYYTLLRISRDNTRPPLSVYRQNGWRPIDLTFNETSGLFVFDIDGVVSQIKVDRTGVHLSKLFRIKRETLPADLAANAQSVFATSNNAIGCTIYQYSLASGKTSQRFVPLIRDQPGCDGIAADGPSVYVVFAGAKEIRHWSNWDSQTNESWPFREIDERGGVLAVDSNGHRLIYADRSDTAYGISLPDHKIQALASNVGVVHSIASNSSEVLLASGKKVLFYSRSGFRGENPPGSMAFLSGGLITGIAIDTANSLWVADFDKGAIEGPFAVN